MKISLLKVSNFLKLRDVEIKPAHTTVITGRNKQGKTAVLKAIQAAMDGGLDEKCIRIGEDKAEITLELDDLIVKRTVTEKGAYLDVTNREGMKMPKPQAYLDGLIGSFSFNPVEFFNLKPAEQKKYLLESMRLKVTPELVKDMLGIEAPPVDYDRHALEVVAEIRKHFYDRRTLANGEVSKKRKSIDELSGRIPEGFDPRKVSDEQMDALREAIKKDEVERAKQVAHDQRIADLMRQEADAKEELNRVQLKLQNVQDELAKAKEVVFDASDDVTIAAAKDTLKVLEGQRDIVLTVKQVDGLKTELDAAIKEAAKLDILVEKLTKDVPAALMAKADMPVAGLAVGDDGLTLGGVPLENLSTSEQIRFALNVVRAMNSKFKVILIDGIEALDTETFAEFLKEIENDEFQYWVSRVDSAAAGGIVIEDGAIKG